MQRDNEDAPDYDWEWDYEQLCMFQAREQQAQRESEWKTDRWFYLALLIEFIFVALVIWLN